MPEHRKRYIFQRALGPPLNFSMGLALGSGHWLIALGILGTFLLNKVYVDTLFWRESDLTQKRTRQKVVRDLQSSEKTDGR